MTEALTTLYLVDLPVADDAHIAQLMAAAEDLMELSACRPLDEQEGEDLNAITAELESWGY